MKEIIQVDNLTVKYGPSVVLDNLSFTVEAGDYIGLAGPNGSGKTTLVKALLGLVHSTGKVKIFNENLGSFKEWNKIGYLPQKFSSFNPLFPASVREVIGLGLLSSKSWPKKIIKKDNKKINELLETLEISGLDNRQVGELSGGQQQRVFLARALVSNPEILILDEPSTALDPSIRESFFTLINKLNKEHGVTIILITHDTGRIGNYAKKLIYLDKKIIFYGLFGDFCQSAQMGEYFGDFTQHIICHQH